MEFNYIIPDQCLSFLLFLFNNIIIHNASDREIKHFEHRGSNFCTERNN